MSVRSDLPTLTNEDAPRPDTAEGYFMYANGHAAGESVNAILKSPPSASGAVQTCMTFAYSIFVSYKKLKVNNSLI